ncbi:MAG TPA: deaminase [Acidimicrobiia bacterium]
MAEDDERWMREALRVAEAGLGVGELPIGAVVVVGEEIVAEAHTAERREQRLLVHAEMLALDNADHVLIGRRRQAKLYTTLEPCLGCLGAAMTVMIGTIVYALGSASDGAASFAVEWDKQRSTQDFPAYALPSIRGDVLAQQSRALFARFVEQAEAGDPLAQWAQTLIR